jgi:hypothetical protein
MPVNASSSPPLAGAPQPSTSGLAIWSLVLGILSLLCAPLVAAIPGVICGHMALGRIKRSGGAVAGQGLAIAGLVTGYLGIAWAMLFLPLMAAIAVPNFVRARQMAQANACIQNLKLIQHAKELRASDKQWGETAVPTLAELGVQPPNGATTLTCPAGGVYSINPMGMEPTCSVRGHELP